MAIPFALEGLSDRPNRKPAGPELGDTPPIAISLFWPWGWAMTAPSGVMGKSGVMS